MDFQLPEELRMLKDQLRRFVDTQMIPVERETCEGQELKPEYRAKFESHIKQMGLWMMDVPAEFGGGDMSLLASVVVWQELARTIALPARGTMKASAVAVAKTVTVWPEGKLSTDDLMENMSK